MLNQSIDIEFINKHEKHILRNFYDGGFVFKNGRKFNYYKSILNYSKINEPNLFATWFRLLDIAFLNKSKNIDVFVFGTAPGYHVS